MEELRLTFLIFGALAIAGILVHGLWTVRKQRAKKDRSPTRQVEHTLIDPEDSDFDAQSREKELEELGLGPVRVVSREESGFETVAQSSAPQQNEAPDVDETVPEPPSFMLKDGPEPETESTPTPAASQDSQETEPEEKTSPATSPQRQSQSDEKPTDNSQSDPAPKTEEPALPSEPEPAQRREPTIGENTEVVAEPEPELDISAEPTSAPQPEPEEKKASSFAERARQSFSRSAPKGRKRRTPKVREDQITMDFDEQPKDAPEVSETQTVEDTPPDQQEVLVLNVKAPEGKPIGGDALLPALLTLGFKFGDQDIFHRHVNSNGKGPVLFSLANMFKPGVFDIDNMENFTTQGISLFMILPIEGDPHQVFNMMHNAARKLADEFGAQVLDGRRSALTKQSVQQYVEKIREFERRRMIRRNR